MTLKAVLDRKYSRGRKLRTNRGTMIESAHELAPNSDENDREESQEKHTQKERNWNKITKKSTNCERIKDGQNNFKNRRHVRSAALAPASGRRRDTNEKCAFTPGRNNIAINSMIQCKSIETLRTWNDYFERKVKLRCRIIEVPSIRMDFGLRF